MTANLVRDTINRLLVQEFPQAAVDLQNSAGDFKRPVFTLEATHQQPTDVNFSTIEERLDLLIKYQGPENGHGDSDMLELNDVRDRLLAFFPLGRLQVGDRSIRCELDSGVDQDGAWLSIGCTWWDERPQGPRPEVMQELTVNTQMGTNTPDKEE